MLVTEYLRNDIRPLGPLDLVDEAHQTMDDYKVSHLPVVDNGHYLGMVTEDDLLNAESEKLSVKDGSTQLIRTSIEPDRHIFDALSLFHIQHLSMLPVVDEKGGYHGYLYPEDIVDLLGGDLSFSGPGGIIVLEVNINDYHLSEVAQIVESNDAKILALYLSSVPDSTKLELTLRINNTDLSRILETFNRYNYTILASYHQSLHAMDLKDRFDAFMKYLNM
ncbi:MAG: CBS domain-containing protein [Bacteroidota bacterium]|nr:CBS domain-containing protein [Bacteroidota bacterium]